VAVLVVLAVTAAATVLLYHVAWVDYRRSS
jgi:hypothetical protein